MSSARKRVLFICTGNACRSQMAEAWTRHLLGDRFDACSAGIAPHGVDPRAVQVMRERGVDMSGHASKSVASLRDSCFDLAVTVCDRAAATCPAFQNATRSIHHGFDDPPRLARKIGDQTLALQPYREVRDRIRAFVLTLPDIRVEPATS